MTDRQQSIIQTALDRLATAEISLYECEQYWKQAHADVGIAFRQERLSRGLSLRSVAKSLGYSAVFIGDCEHGERRFSPALMLRYRTILQHS